MATALEVFDCCRLETVVIIPAEDWLSLQYVRRLHNTVSSNPPQFSVARTIYPIPPHPQFLPSYFCAQIATDTIPLGLHFDENLPTLRENAAIVFTYSRLLLSL